MHLYSVDASASNATARQLTQGKWEIESAALSATRKRSTSRARRASGRAAHLLDASQCEIGGERTKLTSMTAARAAKSHRRQHHWSHLLGRHEAHEVYVMPEQAGRVAKQVTTTPTDEWRSFKWVEPQLITYKTRDGVDRLRAPLHA